MTQAAPDRHMRRAEKLSAGAVEFIIATSLVAIQITWLGAIGFCVWKAAQLVAG